MEAAHAAVDEKDDGRVEYMMAGIEEPAVCSTNNQTAVIQRMTSMYEANQEKRRRTYVRFYDSDSDSDDEANDPALLHFVPKSRLWKRRPGLDPPLEKYDSEGFSVTDDCEVYDDTCEGNVSVTDDCEVYDDTCEGNVSVTDDCDVRRHL